MFEKIGDTNKENKLFSCVSRNEIFFYSVHSRGDTVSGSGTENQIAA